MGSRRILLLHEHHGLEHVLRRVCEKHRARLAVAASQSHLFEVLSTEPGYADLVVAKDVSADWFTVAAALLACRACGVLTPFIISGDPGDRWSQYAVECAGSAVLIDDLSSVWLLPLLIDDWLASASQEHADVTHEAGGLWV